MPQIDRIARLKGPLRITCCSCRHEALWQPAQAVARLGGEANPTDAKRRLRCSICGERRTYRIEFSA